MEIACSAPPRSSYVGGSEGVSEFKGRGASPRKSAQVRERGFKGKGEAITWQKGGTAAKRKSREWQAGVSTMA